MTELEDYSDRALSLGEITHDMNLITLEVLDEMEHQDKKYKTKERLWKAGIALSVATFISGIAIEFVSLGKKEIEVEAGAGMILGSTALGVSSLNRYDQNREKGQAQALGAAKLSLSVNDTIQPWIARRLAERDRDIQNRMQIDGTKY